MILTGQVLDSSNKPLEKAVVYVSDSKGKPKGANSYTTDNLGRWTLNLDKSDYVTSRLVGYKQTTMPVSAAKVIPAPPMTNVPPTNALVIKMQRSSSANLPEVGVSPTSTTPISTTPMPEEKKKNWLRIGLIAGGGLLVLGLIVYLATKGKSPKK
jgi:hypothetical protein